MTELQLTMQERRNTGTAWTRNESFEKNGYLVVKDLWDPEELYHPVPEQKGQYNYYDKTQSILILFLLSIRLKVLLHVIGIHNIAPFTLVFVRNWKKQLVANCIIPITMIGIIILDKNLLDMLIVMHVRFQFLFMSALI